MSDLHQALAELRAGAAGLTDAAGATPALHPLSHGHQHALAVSLKLVRADVDSMDWAQRAFLRYWCEEGRQHLRDEDEILFPAFAEYGDPGDPLLLRALADHLAIRRRAQRMERGVPEPLWGLHQLGTQLADHVRLEERQLFPRIEQVLPDAELEQLAAALAASR